LDKLTAAYPVNGVMFKKIFYDPEVMTVRSELVYPQDMFVPNDAPSIEAAEFFFHRLTRNKNQMISHLRSGLWSGVEEKDILEDYIGGDDQEPTKALVRAEDKQPANFSSVYEIVEAYVWCDFDGDGYCEPYVISFSPKLQKIVRVVPRYEEGDISRNDKGKITKIQAIEFFTEYDFMQSSDGSIYSLGLGELLLPINEAINSSINQLLDAGKLNNTGGGWVSKALRLAGGKTEFEPGEWKQVNSFMGKLADNIFPKPQVEPSPVTFNLLKTLIEAGTSIGDAAHIRDIQLPSNLSAVSSMSIIENGMMSLKSVYKRFHRSLSKELTLISKWVRRYPDMDEYQRVIGEEANEADFEFSAAIVPVSDPNLITTISKATKAQQIEDMQKNHPGVLDAQKAAIKVLELVGLEPTELIKTEVTVEDVIGMLKQQKELQLVDAEIVQKLASALRWKDEGVATLARANSETMARVSRSVLDMKNAALVKEPVIDANGKISSVEVSRPEEQYPMAIKALAEALGISFSTPIGEMLGKKIQDSISQEALRDKANEGDSAVDGALKQTIEDAGLSTDSSGIPVAQ